MPKVDQTTHEGRKERVFLTLRRYPLGLSEAELEQLTDIQRRTLNNYLRALETEGKVYKEEGSILWFALPYDQVQLRKFDLSPEEGMTLYLAARLFVKQHDKRNEPAETALMKLAAALTAHAGVGQEIHQAAIELSHRPDDGSYNKIFRTLMQAYIYRRVAHITYEPAVSPSFKTDFSPYLLEPSAIGFTTYAIGHSSVVNAWRTYKLERIRSAVLTRQEYWIPANFPGLDILKNAWSIIGGEEIVPVTLRFSPAVRKRVLETRWHPSEDKQEDSENPGYLIWTAKVADITDMLPWVRGWGADVEVLGPKEMREALITEARRLVRVYGIEPAESRSTLTRMLRCWGKTARTDKNPNEFHPVLFHMLDVGHVARELLSERASPRWRRVLANALGADPTALADWLPWFVALHDVGKIAAPFQSQNDAQRSRMKAEGFVFGDRLWNNEPYHQIVGAVFVDHSTDGLPLPNTLRESWRDMIGGHHGRFAIRETIEDAQRRLSAEPPEWATLRAEASGILKLHLLQNPPEHWPVPGNVSTATMALTGFTVLCDWLGSNEAHFALRPDVPLREYLSESAQRAYRAVEDARFFQPWLSESPSAFTTLFSNLKQPRPLQLSIDGIPADVLAGPCLAIIEAPTGEGKTEAGLALAHRLAQAGGTDELYYALPTAATSNQMFGRLQTYLHERLGLPTQVKLVHGQAFLIEDDLLIEPLGNGRDKSAATDWFGHDRRKALLLPFGVGTIDQAELAALNVPFTAVRLVGLAGKVVIMDEVHAYDTYMTTIIEQLLKWLSALGSSVILLSATLPLSRRRALARAFGVEIDETDEASDAYPSVCLFARTGRHRSTPPASQPDRRIEASALHFSDEQIEDKAQWLLAAVSDGGCVCWITNTVERAQAVFESIDALAAPDVRRLLIHARFPLDDRQRLERELMERYGPDGDRPAKAIVLGTQVLEQSLDLDFDVMVSDLAPIDFLLQRAGRLHRHARRDSRPAAHAVPRFWINVEMDSDGGPLLNRADKVIYDEYILRKTWAVLDGRATLDLPRDYRLLIEAVYSDEEPAPGSAFQEAWENLQKKQAKASGKALLRVLPEPDPEWSFCARMARLTFDDDENSAAWSVAQTRLGEESLTVIPLQRMDNRARLWPDDDEVNLDAETPRAIQKKLMRRSIRLSHHQAVEALKAGRSSLPRLFSESALLKDCVPLWLTDGQARLVVPHGALHVKLDPRLGLVIRKDTGA